MLEKGNQVRRGASGDLDDLKDYIPIEENPGHSSS